MFLEIFLYIAYTLLYTYNYYELLVRNVSFIDQNTQNIILLLSFKSVEKLFKIYNFVPKILFRNNLIMCKINVLKT